MKNAVMSVSNRSENFVVSDGIENPLPRQMNCHYLIEVLLNNFNESVNIKQLADEFVLMMRGVECSEGTKLYSFKKAVLETDFLSLRSWIFAQLKEATKKENSANKRLAANGFKVEVSIEGLNRFVKLSKRSNSSTSIKNYIQLNQIGVDNYIQVKAA